MHITEGSSNSLQTHSTHRTHKDVLQLQLRRWAVDVRVLGGAVKARGLMVNVGEVVSATVSESGK